MNSPALGPYPNPQAMNRVLTDVLPGTPATSIFTGWTAT